MVINILHKVNIWHLWHLTSCLKQRSPLWQSHHTSMGMQMPGSRLRILVAWHKMLNWENLIWSFPSCQKILWYCLPFCTWSKAQSQHKCSGECSDVFSRYLGMYLGVIQIKFVLPGDQRLQWFDLSKYEPWLKQGDAIYQASGTFFYNIKDSCVFD